MVSFLDVLLFAPNTSQEFPLLVRVIFATHGSIPYYLPLLNRGQRFVLSILFAPQDHICTPLTQAIDRESIDLTSLLRVLVGFPSGCVLMRLALLRIVALAVRSFAFVGRHG